MKYTAWTSTLPAFLQYSICTTRSQFSCDMRRKNSWYHWGPDILYIRISILSCGMMHVFHLPLTPIYEKKVTMWVMWGQNARSAFQCNPPHLVHNTESKRWNAFDRHRLSALRHSNHCKLSYDIAQRGMIKISQCLWYTQGQRLPSQTQEVDPPYPNILVFSHCDTVAFPMTGNCLVITANCRNCRMDVHPSLFITREYRGENRVYKAVVVTSLKHPCSTHFTRLVRQQVLYLHQLTDCDISESSDMKSFVAFVFVAATLIAGTVAVPQFTHPCDKSCHQVKPVCPEGEAPTGGEGCWGCCQPIVGPL